MREIVFSLMGIALCVAASAAVLINVPDIDQAEANAQSVADQEMKNIDKLESVLENMEGA